MALNSTPRTWTDFSDIVTAAMMNAEVRDPFTGIQAAWTGWTPTWTNLTVGNGALVPRFLQIGKTIVGKLTFTLGTTSAITGAVRFTLPVSPSVFTTNVVMPIGQAFIVDVSVPTRFRRTVCLDGVNSTATIDDDSFVSISGTVPMTWATGDTLALSFNYEAL